VKFVHSKFLIWLLSGVLVIIVTTGGAVVLGGAANAAPAPGTLGTLTFTPTTGSDTQIITASTSAGCSSESNAADLEVTGPVGAATPVFPPGTVITTTQNNTFSTTKSFTIPEGVSLKDAADILHTTIVPGEYDFTVVCQDQDFLTRFGTFTGAVFFTDATHYNTGAANPPSPSASLTTSPSASPTTSPSASPTTTTSPTTSDSATTTSANELERQRG
jgi:hypothetical protein